MGRGIWGAFRLIFGWCGLSFRAIENKISQYGQEGETTEQEVAGFCVGSGPWLELYVYKIAGYRLFSSQAGNDIVFFIARHCISIHDAGIAAMQYIYYIVLCKRIFR